MSKLVAFVKNLWYRKEGAALVEYGLLVALIAVACIVVTRTLGQEISSVFGYITGQLSSII